MKELIEKRKELEAKSGILSAVFKQAGDPIDLSKVKTIGDLDVKSYTTVQISEEIRKLNDELTELGKEVDMLAQVEKAAQDVKEVQDRIKNPASFVTHPTPDAPSSDQKSGFKGLGDAIVASDLFKTHQSGTMEAGEVQGFGLKELKTLFQTSAGWEPESTRIGRLVDAVTRPIQVIDIIPSGQTGQASIVYMEETTRTHGAAERAEAAAYAESTFALGEKTSPVRSIGDSVPVTDEQLADVPQVQSYLNQRLAFGVRQRLDGQILNGDGTAPNLRGILNTTGIQTIAKGSDPVPDAIYKALTKIRVTGRAMPSHVLVHPNDWQAVRLLRTSDGLYIWGSPSESGPERIWGLPVVQTDVLTENTALVGDFPNFCQLFERQGLDVRLGFVNDDFTKGKQTIRAGMRVAFLVYRATAFSTITGI